MNNMHKKIRGGAAPGKQRGFTILEALIAFLILSVGMLGIGGLQVVSLKAGKTASYRTVAVIKVEEMFERIRNNPMNVSRYDTLITPGVDLDCNDHGPLTSCDSLQMVANDIFEWNQELEDNLSDKANLSTTITVSPPVAGVNPLFEVIITVSWDEANTDTNTMDTMNYSANAYICNNTAC